MGRALGWLLGLYAVAACTPNPHELRAECPAVPPPYEPGKPRQERDELLMRLAWTLTADIAHGAPSLPLSDARVAAAVVVDGSGTLCWARAARHPLDHPAERALSLAAAQTGQPGSSAWTLYSTHEPCAHCTGAAVLLPALAIHFDLDDGPAGKSWERLYQDTHRVGGHCPHAVPVQKSQVPVLTARIGQGAVAGLLREPVDELRAELQGWSLAYLQNEDLLRQIQSMLASPRSTATEGCVRSP